MRKWIREWWITLRFGSALTPAGRSLRRALRDASDAEWVEVKRPTTTDAEWDARALAALRGDSHGDES